MTPYSHTAGAPTATTTATLCGYADVSRQIRPKKSTWLKYFDWTAAEACTHLQLTIAYVCVYAFIAIQ